MDEADIADRNGSVINGAAIADIRKEAHKPVPTSKTCLECGAPTTNGARWCCVECRDAWERRNEGAHGR